MKKCCLKDSENGGGLEARLEELEPPKAGHGPNRPRKPAPGLETCRSGARARPTTPRRYLVPGGQAGRSHLDPLQRTERRPRSAGPGGVPQLRDAFPTASEGSPRPCGKRAGSKRAPTPWWWYCHRPYKVLTSERRGARFQQKPAERLTSTMQLPVTCPVGPAAWLCTVPEACLPTDRAQVPAGCCPTHGLSPTSPTTTQVVWLPQTH